MNKANKKRILVAMSGGVDSSVAAALLLKGGFDVEGVYMSNWSDQNDIFGVCSTTQDKRDALSAAAHLGIKLHLVNFENDYRKKVLDYFFKEYSKGRTPNPDVWCNRYIKFGKLFEFMKKNGFEFVATGHYAGVETDKVGVHLLCSKDKKKDQTYFLHQLTQAQLKQALFPLQNYEKSEVRNIAKKIGLPNHSKKDSVGICFIGEVGMFDFLMQKIKIKKGKIINIDTNEVVGEHNGVAFYTIGQRHGTVGGNNARLYVVKKDIKKNIIWVGAKDNPLLKPEKIIVKNINWIPKKPTFPLVCKARIRHGGELHNVTVYDNLKNSGGYTVTFYEKPWAAAPGQFCVFYSKNECVGGGVIN